MSRAIQNLAQIPFGTLIGQPLKAAVEAQAIAAQTSIDFIQKVGFLKTATPANGSPLVNGEDADAQFGEVRNVTFKYSKKDENGDVRDFNLTVPILAIVPIPYLRIDEMTIDFRARLTDMVEHNSSSSFALNSSVSASYRSWWSPVSAEFRTSVSYQSSNSTKSTSASEYTMDIHVRAVQDALPAGLTKILDLLEQGIQDTPSN